MTGETLGRFKRWFWRPPRAHGEAVADRQVSNLELSYDLAYVAVIGQAAHHLATHVTVAGLAEFAVVFALTWIAWVNGSLYLELHGRQDGRTRSLVFAQMGILVLAVWTAEATDASGRGFALVYATYQLLQAGLWSSVWLQDRRERPEFQAATAGYVAAIGGRRWWSGPAPCWRPPHGWSCGPAWRWPGSSGSCWPPGAPGSAWA